MEDLKVSKPDLKSTIIVSHGTDKKHLIRVLLVDDETGFLNVTKKILEIQKTLRIDTATSIKEAYLKLNKKKFDIIVSDYQIPIKNGLQFLKELKEKGNNIPFILFTGKGREEVTIQALNLGANRYINKIGNPETVYGELTHAIIQEVEKHRSKQMLIESEEKYRVLVENAADGVAILQGTIFKFSNKRLAQILGYKQEELVGSEFVKLIPPENREWLIGRYKKRIAGDVVPAVYDIPALKKNGEKIQLEINTAFIQYRGNPASMAVIRDITERKKTEEDLEKSEEKYRNIVEFLPDGIMIMTMRGTVISVNKAFLDLTGFSEEEIVGKHFTRLGTLRARDMPKFIKYFAGLLRGRLPPVYEFVYYRKDGSRRWGEAHFSFIKKDGENAEIHAILRDITERKKAEINLSKELSLMETLLGYHPDFIYFKDNKARFQQVSNRFCELLGLDKEKIIGKSDLELFPKEIAKKTYNEDLQVIKTGKPMINKEEYSNGIWVLTTKMPWINKNGKIVGLFGISRDITERKRAEDSLRVQKEFIDNVINAMDDTFFIFESETGKAIQWNNAFKEISGYSDEEIRSLKAPASYYNEEDIKIASDAMQKIIKSGRATLEMSLITKDGKHVPFEYVGVRVKSPEGKAWVCAIGRNVAERKKAEEEIKELAKFPSENPSPVLRITNDGMILYSNKAAKILILGSKQDQKQHTVELIQKSVLDCLHSGLSKEVEVKVEDKIFSFVYSSIIESGYVNVYGRDITEKKKAEEQIKRQNILLKGILENTHMMAVYLDAKFNFIFVNKAYADTCRQPQSFFEGKNHFDLYPSEEMESIFRNVVDSGKPVFIEARPFEFPDQPQRGITYWDWSLIPIKDSKNEVTELVFTLVEVTDRIKAEKEGDKTLEKLGLLNEKWDVVGKLTRHDARNKLSVVMGNIYLAEQRLPQDSETIKFLKKADSAINQIEKIFDFARMYERLGVEKPSVVDAGLMFNAAVSLLPDLSKMDVVNDCKDCSVLADSLLVQLFYNLMDNSLKHGECVSKIRIYCKVSKDKLRLIYEDNGIGIREDQKEKIFIEGYGKSTGLGLHMIKLMCNIYGWTIKETGKQTKGAQFTISIPKTNQKD